MNFFKLIDKIISNISESIAAIGIFSGVLIAFINVVARYSFNKSLVWASELTMYFFIWSIFFGTVYGFKKDAHISVNILLEKLPAKISKIILLFSYLITSLFLIAVAYYGYKYLLLVIELDEKSIDLDIPMWIPYLVIPISFLFSFYRVVEKFVINLKTPANEIKFKSESDDLLNDSNTADILKEMHKKTGGLL